MLIVAAEEATAAAYGRHGSGTILIGAIPYSQEIIMPEGVTSGHQGHKHTNLWNAVVVSKSPNDVNASKLYSWTAKSVMYRMLLEC